MNKVASVVLLDVGCRSNEFLREAKACLTRLLIRKMLTGDNDEVGVVLFGCDNSMGEGSYVGVSELGRWGPADMDIVQQVAALQQVTTGSSDWVRALPVALETLRKGVQGKRFGTKQVLLISDLAYSVHYEDVVYQTLVSVFTDLKAGLTVVTPDLDLSHSRPFVNFIKLLEDPLQLSIEELSTSLKYFDKKRRTKRVFNVDLEIGSQVKIPVGWVKLDSEPQRLTCWITKRFEEEGVKEETTATTSTNEWETAVEETTPSIEEASTLRMDEEKSDVFRVVKFGSTEVTLSSADLGALKRETGPPSFKLLVFANKGAINPTHYVGTNVYAVLPKQGSQHAHAQLGSLIQAMKEKSKVGIARRVVMRNGKIQLGVLLPFSDDDGKHLYFMRLPTVEWAQPFPRSRPCHNPPSEDLKSLFRDLVTSMRLPQDLVEEGQGLLVPNPLYQLRCQIIADRATDSECEIKVPPQVQSILDPCPELRERSRTILEKILEQLPLLDIIDRKSSTATRKLSRAQSRAKPAQEQLNQKEEVQAKEEEIDFRDREVEIKEECYIQDNEEDEEEKKFLQLIDKLSAEVNDFN